HADMTVDEARFPLGMERNEVELGADTPRGVIGAAGRVREEGAEELRGRRRARPAGVRSAYPRFRDGAPDGGVRDVMQPAALFDGAAPVEPVRLVPDLPGPGGDPRHAVALDSVPAPGLDELGPALIVFRRPRPAGGDAHDTGVGEPVPIRRRSG